MNDDTLTIWTIYFNPSDYPGKFVMRKSLATAPGIAVATDEVHTGDSLNDVREHVPPWAVRMNRADDDDPNIVESWL